MFRNLSEKMSKNHYYVIDILIYNLTLDKSVSCFLLEKRGVSLHTPFWHKVVKSINRTKSLKEFFHLVKSEHHQETYTGPKVHKV